jgi:LacI family transcriptional regulator
MSRRPTIKEVSKLAGVSFKTVSRVLNNEKNVSDETRRRVEQAVADLNFRPSMAARTLAGRKSFQIGLLYDNPDPYYVYHLQAGAQDRCTQLGYRLLSQPVDSAAPALVANVLALIDETHLDGLILTPPITRSADLIDALDGRSIETVGIGPDLHADRGRSVGIDDLRAAQDMTAHLIALGHRRIGFVAGPPDHPSSTLRLNGYRAALDAARLAFDPALVVAGDYSLQGGRAAGTALLGGDGARPDAIFASSDAMAAGVLAVAHELAIEVPGALAIAGFNDSDLASAVWPPLTTVRQPIRDLGHAAADLLLTPDQRPGRLILPHAIVTRASTGEPR